MLLIAGGAADPNIRALAARAEARGVDHLPVLTAADASPRLSWDVDADTLAIDGEDVAPTGAFLRWDVFGTPSFLATAWYTALNGWVLSRPDVRLLNRGRREEVNKARNLVLARRAGLRLPRTIVTNEIAALEERDDVARLVVKPLAGGLHTQELAGLLETTRRIDGAAPAPAFVQQRLAAPELRIYGVGARRFAFRMESAALDYRTDPTTRVVPVLDPPPDLTAGVGRLMAALGLDYAAADFKSDDRTGELLFLEINSGPMFAAFDEAVEGELTDALIDWLLAPEGA